MRLWIAGIIAVGTGPATLHGQAGYAEAVAVGDGEVVVGESLNEATPGYVFIYRRSGQGWTETTRLEAPDAFPGDHFGRAVAIDGPTLLVGATVPDETRGAVYVFRKREDGSWAQGERLVASDREAGDAFGRVIALDGAVALVSSWAKGGGRGKVYVFERATDGSWVERGALVADEPRPGDWFGMSMAVRGNVAVVGTPRRGRNAGVAWTFRRGPDGRWEREQALGGDRAPGDAFGTAVTVAEGMVMVGAPGMEGGSGAAFVYRFDPVARAWEEEAMLRPFDAGRRALFGSALAGDGEMVWIGAPGAEGGAGRAYRVRQQDGAWVGMERVVGDGLSPGDLFSATLAARGEVAVAGLRGDDFGVGTAMILGRSGNRWRSAATVRSPVSGYEPVVGEETECIDGLAVVWGCDRVDLAAFLPIREMGGGRGIRLNDLWGWADPETGREFALVGRTDGTSFVEVTDPRVPVYLGDLPLADGATPSTWRDIKVYRNHAYIVSDGAGRHGMQVFDLRELRTTAGTPVTFQATAHYDRIHSAHNLVINEQTGFAYSVGGSSGGETCGGGLHMIDVREPSRPTFAGCFADASTGRASTGYAHDAQCVIYIGPDTTYADREICFGANETALSIADVTDKANPVPIARASYPNVGYSHQGWLSEDHRFFFMNDELDEASRSVSGTRTLVWDVSELDDPILVTEHISRSRASDHNLYVRGNLMYQSNYQAGLRVLDVADPTNPRDVAFFDTMPYGSDGPGFDGSWSNYPFLPSGVVLVTSAREGLFILRVRPPEIIP